MPAFEAQGWVHGEPRTVRASESGLAVDGHIMVRRVDVDEGHLMPGARWTARLWLRNPRGTFVDVALTTREDAAAVLEALGMRASDVFVSLVGSYGAWATVLRASVALSLLAVPFLCLLIAFPWVTLVSLGSVLALLFLLYVLTRTRLEVGADGVRVEGPLVHRFLRHADLRDARARAGKLILRPKEGAPLSIHVGGGAWSVARRILAARSLLSLEDPDMTAKALLSRGTRQAEEWVERLHALTSTSDYRSQALEPSRLWRIVEDPRGEETARAGAVFALAPSLDPEERARLRVTASACAAPELRALLETVADEADDARVKDAVMAVARR